MNKVRPHPAIPDHEVLRKIGGGAYGEVWLARGVTGAMRAVKVVWREDFEDERTFEREFEGILRFEPISRDHPGLVNILHVGRSPDRHSFYYYVMELGDDIHRGREIHPVEYEPRTLRADSKGIKAKKFPIDECIDVGLRLAEALEHLHEKGLAHRDIKPSNIIFVGGKAKLADIGLVAARGQRTFVGTEGFVPPEGPGSAQADVYSLGKVLYEIATGKDRLDFPELPDEAPPPEERKKWLALNRVICDVCEPQLSKRKISTASDLADAMRLIQRGKRRRFSRRTPLVMTLVILLAAAATITWKRTGTEHLMALWHEWTSSSKQDDTDNPTQKFGRVKIVVEPEGASIRDADGRYIGETQSGVLKYPAGTILNFTLRKEGYQEMEITHTVREGLAPVLIEGQMQIYAPPIEGEPWVDHLGIRYLPEGEMHVSKNFVPAPIWNRYLNAEKRAADTGVIINITENGHPARVVATSPQEAERFCRWHQRGASTSYLTEDQEIMPRLESQFQHPSLTPEISNKGFRPFRVVVRPVPYGELVINSNPPNVEVYIAGQNRGRINGPTSFEKVPTGNIELVFLLDGYKPQTRQITLQNKEQQNIEITLEKNHGVVFGKPWKNSIDMQLAPIGEDLMASIWETRVADFDTFTKETKRPPIPKAQFQQTPLHPVVFCNRTDANEFCAWLTERERKSEYIQISHEYRLPNDAEWSMLAGLPIENGNDPAERDANELLVWPWGQVWPPPAWSGNFADKSALDGAVLKPGAVIIGFNDTFANTAPVGTFPANRFGLHDISGNVHEWVADNYSSKSDKERGVLRGAGWSTHLQSRLSLAYRNTQVPNKRDSIYGFRVVLARVATTQQPSQ